MLRLALPLLFAAGLAQAGPQAFPLSAVRLQDGPLLAAQQRDRDTLLALDADRLLAPYRREAGLPESKPSYGNWESSGLDGHMAGHYLSALAMMSAASGDPSVRERLDQVMAGLKQAQLPSGYLGGIPKGEEAWGRLAAGTIQVDNFSLNGRWVPWYNLHKIAAGLRDAHVHAAHPDALPMLRAFADWAERVTAGLSDEQMEASLRSEHGGMNEWLADLAALSGNEPRYLRLARRFSHQALLQPLLRGEDSLTGMHANTQIPKVIGFARLAELGAEPGWLKAAQSFWQTVVERRTVAIGGNSVKEHFHDAANFQPMLDEVEGPETCNSVNMVRLSEALFRMDPQSRYADYVERTLFNHLLASQHPQHGGFVYFTPLRPQHYRVYSAPHEAMWCCVGSGLESHARHGAFVYAHEGETLYVNLFAASTLEWVQQGVRVRQQTRFPDEAATRLIVEQGGRFALRIRQPAWTRGMALQLNGKTFAAKAHDGYLQIPSRTWRTGDRVDIKLPMRTTLEPLPGRPDQVS
ncbi:MAG: beta-L-arabinofuranosidase domain-containing protein, partial [Inhella sp.]